MTDIAGKNVLITGGADGIGRLMALRMAERGSRLAIWDIAPDRLDRTLGELARCSTHKPYAERCDVSNSDDVHNCAHRVLAEMGHIDILINNAGVVSGKSFLEIQTQDIEKTFSVNTLSLFWTCQAFLPQMISRNIGHVVTVASAAGVIGVSKLSDYCASKFAAFGFDESLRVELSQIAPNVKTTIVCPFFIDTGMFKGVKTRFSFLLPILQKEEVALHIVQAIEKNKKRLMMPKLVYLVPLLRLLPVGLFDSVAEVLGINQSMESFQGHKTP